jgi:M6 family metalloprotease-like protein
MSRSAIRRTILWCSLIAVPAGAVQPPEADIELPVQVKAAQIELSRSYGESGIARRLRELKVQKETATKTGESFNLTPPAWNVPVIMGSYSDNANIFSSAQFQTNLFGANPTGSMTAYYNEVSYGQFSLSGTVYGPYTAAQTQAYYVNGDYGFGSDFPTNASGFIYSILDVGDPSINFAQYDNDGPDGVPNSGDDDGYVDALVVIFPDGDASGGDSDNFWAHRWNLRYGAGAPYTTGDARAGGGFIQIDVYTVQAAEQRNGTYNIIKPIGVFCHEFGHVVGLPDLYDTDNPRTSYGVGTYDLMGAGSWGAAWNYTTEHRPTHMSAWCKAVLGWLTPIEIVGTQSVQIPPVETNPTVYKLWDDAYQGGRFFLLENRTKTGFDADIYGNGVLVWHCNDEVRWDNSVDYFRIVDLEEADGLNHIDNMVNWMDAGDFYPGSTNKTAFDGSSNPNSNDVFGLPTGVVALGFANGPGSSVSVTLTQRTIEGFTIAYDNYAYMGGWGYGTAQVNHGAVRFTAPTGGELVSVQAGVWESNPVGYSVRIFDDMVAGSPVGLNSTTTGVFPTLPNNRYHEVPLSSGKTLSPGQVFLVDVAFGPDVYAVPFSAKAPSSGKSYFSQLGSTYDHWTDKDCLIRARVRFPVLHTWHVSVSGNDVTGDGTSISPFRTIQYAVNSAHPEDTVMVDSGTYTEHVSIHKNLVLIGEGGGLPVIDASLNGSGLQCDDLSHLTVMGFTFTNIGGYPTEAIEIGGQCSNVLIEGNRFEVEGGSTAVNVFPTSGNIRITKNLFIGGVYTVVLQGTGQPVIGQPVISYNTFYVWGAVAIYCPSTSIPTIEGNIVSGKPNWPLSGGIWKWDEIDWSHATIQFNDFWACTEPYAQYSGTSFTPVPGIGEISADPSFRNAPALDFQLSCGSPCIDAGNPASPTDPDGTRADIGAIYFDKTDSDGDGVSNQCDNCPTISNANQLDSDSDGVGDACDPDDDNDGVLDGADNCPLIPNSTQLNTDGDALGDACDPDDDNDGVLDGADNCPLIANSTQLNTDGDALGDACDPDDDNDGVLDGADNCPLAANPGQQDANGDGIGDACCCVGRAGNVDCDAGNSTDISDLSILIDNLYITFTPLCCPKTANVDGATGIDISDISALIDYLYLTFTLPALCN